MQSILDGATKALSVGSKIAQSPYTQYLVDRVRNWYGPKFLAGPLGTDLVNSYNDYQEDHNKIRNLIHGLIIVVVAALSMYYSQTSDAFRNFLGVFATTFKIVDDATSLTDSAYAYIGYMFSTYLATIISKTIFDIAFAISYGDQEFGITAQQADALAADNGVSREEVEAEFWNRVAQLRKSIFAPGASKDELYRELKAMQNKPPAVARAICAVNAKCFNSHLEHISGPNSNNHLLKYKRLLFATARHDNAEQTYIPLNENTGGSPLRLT